MGSKVKPTTEEWEEWFANLHRETVDYDGVKAIVQHIHETIIDPLKAENDRLLGDARQKSGWIEAGKRHIFSMEAEMQRMELRIKDLETENVTLRESVLTQNRRIAELEQNIRRVQ